MKLNLLLNDEKIRLYKHGLQTRASGADINFIIGTKAYGFVYDMKNEMIMLVDPSLISPNFRAEKDRVYWPHYSEKYIKKK